MGYSLRALILDSLRVCCVLPDAHYLPRSPPFLMLAALEVFSSVIPSYHVLQGYVDSSGHDLRSIPGSSLLSCSQTCATTMGCNGFTYVGSSYPDPNVANACFMKTLILPLADLKDFAAELPDILSAANASQRAVGVTFLSSESGPSASVLVLLIISCSWSYS